MATKKITTAINLVEQLLEQAEIEDEERKLRALQRRKATAAVGEGYWPFHLKHLLELLKEIRDD